MRILGIETSCDETSAAIVENGTKILSNVVASSTQMHQKYGGIVPEIAARKQVEAIIPVLEEALNNYSSSESRCNIGTNREVNFENLSNSSRLTCVRSNNIVNSIDAIAVTIGPGLIGSLLVGIETAKTLAMITDKPIIPVNHVVAHMYANFLEISGLPADDSCHRQLQAGNKQTVRNNYSSSEARSSKNSSHPAKRDSNNNIDFPAISLVVSGGHTELYLMTAPNKIKWLGGTIDDAAGECFDKGARILGFGSGGGLAIQQSAEKYVIARSPKDDVAISTMKQFNLSAQAGNLTITHLPRPMLYDKTFNFSFSGLKTALMREVNKYLNYQSRHTCHSLEKGNLKDPRVQACLPAGRPEDDMFINYFSHELQEAITDVLVKKTLFAVEKYQAKSILISGGVASNTRLRRKFELSIINYKLSIGLFAPQINLCTDNASFIASCAYFNYHPVDWKKITAIPNLSVEVKNLL